MSTDTTSPHELSRRDRFSRATDITGSLVRPIRLAGRRFQSSPSSNGGAAVDDLTGLLTRSHLMRALQAALPVAHGGVLEVMFVDLDRFKLINDSYGHHAGDEVLREFARRLQSTVRADDLIGRVGGDEFVVVCRVTDPAEIGTAATRILRSTDEPFDVAGRALKLSASVGLAATDAGNADAEALVQAADIALYEAKRSGRGRVERFTTHLRQRLMNRVELEDDLRTAITDGGLRLHYQPQVDLRNGRVVGVEALVRWEHPTRGMVAPDEFIGVAEECGLIAALGDWVLDEACRQLAAWRRHGWNLPLTTINVSPLQLDRGTFVSSVRNTLARHGLEPSSLCLEVTESALMGRTSGLVTLEELHAFGCYVGIDDFGTGYSSLARLRDLPVDMLKIDRSFVRGLGRDAHDEAIVASIVTMALTMGLHVIAEGVEHAMQAETLTQLGCLHAQGFLFARPEPAQQTLVTAARRLWKPTRAPHASQRAAGQVEADRRGHRYFIHEFLEQIGIPVEIDPTAAP